MGADYLDFSSWLIWLSLGLNVAVVAFVLGALTIQDRRWVRAARNALTLNGFVIVGAAVGLVAGFIKGAYDVEYICNYSERALDLAFKITGLWAGLDGSILFWAALLGVLCAFVARSFKREEHHPVGRRLEPHVYLVLAVVQLFFLSVITIVANPFDTFIENGRADVFYALFPDGVAKDGLGLNPLLINYWMQIHPPCLYVGWVMYTVPFAYGMASLIRGERGRYWIRKVRGWMLVAWLFNTTGCILGGLWAYEVLGWGGYWAWDPVENASILTWFTSTAFLHSIMVQERRDMLRIWNALLICVTFILSLVGTWLTRSGVVSSVHGFSESDIGHWFLAFWLSVTLVTIFLVIYRASTDPPTRNRIESIFSREAAFVLNNMILVAIAAGIFMLTIWPKISNDFLRDPRTVGPPVYNMVFTPFFAVLLFLTAVGPGLGWIRTSARSAIRNLGWAAVAAIPLGALIQLTAQRVHGGEEGAVPASIQFMGPVPVPSGTLYPAALFNYLAAFIITTVASEILRTAWVRARRRAARADEWPFLVQLCLAVPTLLVKNNRRYGGYIVHVGLAVLAIGVVNSSVFQVKKEVQLQVGDSVSLGKYEVTLKGAHDEDLPVYMLNSLEMALTEDGELVASLYPEKRFYKIKKQAVREVSVHPTFWEDIYVYFADTDQRGSYLFTFYRNPLVWGLKVGLLIMLAGGLWAALPLGRKRVGLA